MSGDYGCGVCGADGLSRAEIDAHVCTANILHDADRLTSRDRNQSYGHPYDDYKCVARMWNALLVRAGIITPEVGGLISPELACLMMAAIKMSRLAHDIEHRDSQVDGAGYLRCIEMIQELRKTRQAMYSKGDNDGPG